MRCKFVVGLFLTFVLLTVCYDKTTCCQVDGGCDAENNMSADVHDDADASQP